MDGRIPTAEEFLGLLDQRDEDHAEEPPWKYGTIPGSYAGGMPTVQFDGESAPSTRQYPWIDPYVPVAGHRVLLARVLGQWVIIGRVRTA